MYDCAFRRSIMPRLEEVATQVREWDWKGREGPPVWYSISVASEVEVFGAGVSGFRTPALPFSCEGWIVAVDELAVRECLCPCPGLGDVGVAVCVEVEEVGELREQDDLGEERWGRRALSECWLNKSLVFFF